VLVDTEKGPAMVTRIRDEDPLRARSPTMATIPEGSGILRPGTDVPLPSERRATIV
jgi:hypothetical protein